MGLPTITILVGILINNRQLEQLDRHMNQQITSLRGEMLSQRNELNGRIDSLRGEMSSLRSEMIARLERVEGLLDARLRQVEEVMMRLR